MAISDSLGLITAILVLLWRIPLRLKSTWFPTRTGQRSIEDVPLLQLAEAFARRIELESVLISEKINSPETIRDVSYSLTCFLANLNPDSVTCNRACHFTRSSRLFGDAQSYSARTSSATRNIDANIRSNRVGQEDPFGVTRLPPVERRSHQGSRTLVVFRNRRFHLHVTSGLAAFQR
jgi:hypothetical protein